MPNTITIRAIIQRINRQLRGARIKSNVGAYYVLDYNRNTITHTYVDPKALGRQMGVVGECERVAV